MRPVCRTTDLQRLPVCAHKEYHRDTYRHGEDNNVTAAPYTVRTEEEDGYPVYVLEDPVARAQAWVVPALGFNAYRFSVEPDEHEIGIIDPPPTLAELRARPSFYGTPLLFPFPGRVRGGRFTFGSRPYELQTRQSGSHAIHGFVYNRPWEVIASGPSARDGAVVVGRFESQSFPELATQYPSAFRLEVAYRLRTWTLTVEARAQNVGSEPLPVGYGLHPYFHVPLNHGPSIGGCVIEVPVTRRWELTSDLLPTGRTLPVEEDLAVGVSLEGRSFDTVYTGVLRSQDGSRCVLADTHARLAVVVEADPQFREWVVFTPPRPAVSFEPYTCVPNALNLQAEGIDAGLIVLQPGEARTWTMKVTVRRL